MNYLSNHSHIQLSLSLFWIQWKELVAFFFRYSFVLQFLPCLQQQCLFLSMFIICSSILDFCFIISTSWTLACASFSLLLASLSLNSSSDAIACFFIAKNSEVIVLSNVDCLFFVWMLICLRVSIWSSLHGCYSAFTNILKIQTPIWINTWFGTIIVPEWSCWILFDYLGYILIVVFIETTLSTKD